jgi:ketosteroid isomerase-like protein
MQWLRDFAQAVRDEDYDRGRTLFHADACAFGTRNDLMRGLDTLCARQWRSVWGVTRGFDFDYPSAVIRICGDSAFAAALWCSQGRRDDGTWFDRHGRATYILQRFDGRWLAVHSHHSMAVERP